MGRSNKLKMFMAWAACALWGIPSVNAIDLDGDKVSDASGVSMLLAQETTVHPLCEDYSTVINPSEQQPETLKIEQQNLDIDVDKDFPESTEVTLTIQREWLKDPNFLLKYKKIIKVLADEPRLAGFRGLPKCIAEDVESIQHLRRKEPALLSIDGGGIRGISPLAVLADIELLTGKQCFELFDCIVGTSIGGIIACALGCPRKYNRNFAELVEKGVLKNDPENPYSAQEILTQLMLDGNSIFGKCHNYDVTMLVWGGYRWNHDGLEKMLDLFFGDVRFSQLKANSAAVITLLNEGTVKVPCQRKALKRGVKHDLRVAEICMIGASAPTYFEPMPLQIPSLEVGIEQPPLPVADGGVLMNNPVAWGLEEILQSHDLDVHEVRVLSLGTGIAERNETLDTYVKYNLTSWARYIIDENLKGNVPNKLAKKASKALRITKHEDITGMYIRLQPYIPAVHAQTDDVTQANLEFLEKTGKDMFQRHKGDLEKFFKITPQVTQEINGETAQQVTQDIRVVSTVVAEEKPEKSLKASS